MLTVNAMTAADSVLIPVQPQFYAADGLTELLKVVNSTKKRYNPQIQIEGILYTIDNANYNNAKSNKKAIDEAYGANVHIFDISIPRLEPIAETASMGYSTFEYRKAGKGAECYLQVAKEVLNHA